MNFQFELPERNTPTPPLNIFEGVVFPSSRNVVDTTISNSDLYEATSPSTPDEMALFVEDVATMCKLDDLRREDLHSFRELIGKDLPTRTARMHIYQHALILQIQCTLENLTMDRDAVSEMVGSIKKLLGDHFEITAAQKDEILFTCKRLIMQPNRVDFDFKEEVLAELRKRKDTNGLGPCFENHTRTKNLRSLVGQSVSYVKNVFRMHVRDTLYGPDPRGVTEATREVIKKFLGHGRSAEAKDVIYLMFIRDHARRNRSLLDRDNSPDADAVVIEAPTRKRKRGAGRPAAGADFWSLLSVFLVGKGKEWGSDILNSTGWRSYIEDCLRTERLQFPNDAISDLPSTSGTNIQASTVGPMTALLTTPMPTPRTSRSILTGGGSHNVAANNTPIRSLRGLL